MAGWNYQLKPKVLNWELLIIGIPKYRKKSLYKELRQYLGSMLKDLALQKECKIEEGHLMSDHVHILISIPPKYSVSQVVGFIKGKSAISTSIGLTVWGEERTSLDRVSGQEGITFQQLAEMRQL